MFRRLNCPILNPRSISCPFYNLNARIFQSDVQLIGGCSIIAVVRQLGHANYNLPLITIDIKTMCWRFLDVCSHDASSRANGWPVNAPFLQYPFWFYLPNSLLPSFSNHDLDNELVPLEPKILQPAPNRVCEHFCCLITFLSFILSACQALLQGGQDYFFHRQYGHLLTVSESEGFCGCHFSNGSPN